ncbi:MAG: phospholipid scramblase-related protein [Sciscionella sp.]
MTTSPPPHGWYQDPAERRLQRWWDGTQWTEHTRAGTDAPAPQEHGNTSDASPWELDVDRAPDTDRIRAQAGKVTGAERRPRPGGGTLFTEPVLVVNQKAKLIEMANEYLVFDQDGRQLGSVVEVGQSTLKKVVRFLGKYDQFMIHRLQVRDAEHNVVLKLTRPAKVFKSRILVTRWDDSPVGEIVQENVFGRIRFSFVVDGRPVGGIRAENWRAWDFAVTDHADTEIAKITKTWGGLVRAAFTTADNYVVQVHRTLTEPLASMVVASALTVDTALKQDTE